MESFIKIGLIVSRKISRMKVHTVPRKNGQGKWCYSERVGRGADATTLVFLHGFGADKDMYNSIHRQLPAENRCIAVDMPGHGGTTFVDSLDSLSVEGYVKSIREFLDVINLGQSKVFLIGCSFGGAVAAVFAHTYPECIGKLGLLCPAIKTPILTEACQRMLKGDESLLIPKDGQQFLEMINLMSFTTHKFPAKLLQSFVNMNYTPDRKVLLKKLMTNLLTNEFVNFEKVLELQIKELRVPTLIIWGENDNIVHVSGAKFLHDAIPNSEVKIISKCNHLLQLDQPNEISSAISEFLKK